ncbi:similar to Saccharomyces cerevisiae YOR330C MIP1 Catalytic subunit of the mitochondrial DNA polymerase [Maudiozyma barnettii]|uniref:DNA polymerase gamma n=1 Tax=Maudiozyma barnettii TaxID=61262 RepID=A0A8H2VGM9_9SACH|nr:DNA-directed DNA polymerase gamma MIP1 [Kazachstania barnettii]CAB4254863.1 similar to Saccharomyces cerevisiae YOR330C MIP1 Catalytic subunit of the mitochondrial DNA polymerase [Kazachstania barnettii]CAD1783087.1 similar to Saccharomyces cerevisiae YOR330C MIP1 Catalytic subunit of the mitochondrial DNA polymerase [Kazachstania barnettii]
MSSSGLLRSHLLFGRCWSVGVPNFKHGLLIPLRRYSQFIEQPRLNPVGIQYLSKSLQKQVFGNADSKVSKMLTGLSAEEKQALLNMSRQLLKNHDLLDKKTTVVEPISFDIPQLQGSSLDEHFQKLGQFASEPYKTMAIQKYKTIVKRPEKWIRQSGWTRYAPGEAPKRVPFPLEDVLTFDVETLYKISHYPTLATALSDKAWYAWCSPFICEESKLYKHLIPLDTINKTQLVIGHNVSYDRARVLEEYNFKRSKAFFLDTQSLHIVSSGLSSRQRPTFIKRKNIIKNMGKKGKEDGEDGDEGLDNINLENLTLSDLEEQDPWLNLSTMNSLADVASFHCGIKMDKSPRDYFDSTDKNVIIDNFELLVDYCATDVEVTSKVFDKVFPLFLQRCPHPVSFGALRPLSSCILPTNHNDWNKYINGAESLYQSAKLDIEAKIIQIVEETVLLRDYPTNEQSAQKINNDPWLRQLDWTITPLRLTKKGVPVKRQKLPGYPEWYRSLFLNNTMEKPKITLRSRNIPIFFKLSWESKPVVWTKESGWCFSVDKNELKTFEAKNYILADHESTDDYQTDFKCPDEILFKIPHPNGPNFNCTSLVSKPFIHFYEKEVLKSESDLAHKALQINSSGSYWMSARERIMSQHVVKEPDFPKEFKALASTSVNNEENTNNVNDLGIILPIVTPMGTITRRAVESTWLTASNAKTNRIGSELKTQVKAPPGYCFVGADVDSEELWIASLVGDSVFNMHGGTAIGWMCLEGTKNAGTDLHTKTANILGCSRNEAKIFNYGRIYGAGVKFAGQLLKQFNPSLSDEEVKKVANTLYENTKGKKRRSKIFEQFWYGGSESVLFNKLENIAEQDVPRTPVLGGSITTSLMKKNLKANSYLPSRINWAIQSSGVDYLHLLCCSMHYLIEKYSLNARLCITIHDEIRYLATEEDKYKVAMALQISNLWTRAIFCEQMGIDDLPQNCAFFSAVDIDKVLRKEVDMDCITPSNPVAIPHGESLDIQTLLSKPEAALGSGKDDVNVSDYPYVAREPVFEQYNKSYTKEFIKYFIRMQVQTNKSEVSRLEREYVRELTSNQFSKDGQQVEYDYKDYARDIKQGRKKKINIMVKSFNANRAELDYQHSESLKTDHGPPLKQMTTRSTQDTFKKDNNNNILLIKKPQTLDYSTLHELSHMSSDPVPEKDLIAKTTPASSRSSKGEPKKRFKSYIEGKGYDAFYQSVRQNSRYRSY